MYTQQILSILFSVFFVSIICEDKEDYSQFRESDFEMVFSDENRVADQIQILEHLNKQPEQITFRLSKTIYSESKSDLLNKWKQKNQFGESYPLSSDTDVSQIYSKFMLASSLIGKVSPIESFSFLEREFSINEWDSIKISGFDLYSGEYVLDHIIRMPILVGMFEASSKDYSLFEQLESMSKDNLRNLAENHESMIPDYKEKYFSKNNDLSKIPSRGYFVRDYGTVESNIRFLAIKIQSYVYEKNDVPSSLNDILLVNGGKFSYLSIDPFCPEEDCILRYYGYKGKNKLVVLVSSVGENGKHEIDYSQVSDSFDDFNQETNNGRLSAGDDIFNVIVYLVPEE